MISTRRVRRFPSTLMYAQPGVLEIATATDRTRQRRGLRAGLDVREDTSGWHGHEINGTQVISKSLCGRNTEIHLVAANARTTITFALSPSKAHDAREGRALLSELGPIPEGLSPLIAPACEGDEAEELVFEFGLTPRVPPKSNRMDLWEYDGALYK